MRLGVSAEDGACFQIVLGVAGGAIGAIARIVLPRIAALRSDGRNVDGSSRKLPHASRTEKRPRCVRSRGLRATGTRRAASHVEVTKP